MPPDPLGGPKKRFWAVIVILEKYLRLGTAQGGATEWNYVIQ